MRTARNRWKTYAPGVAAVAALLSSTACEAGGTDNGKGRAPTGAPAQPGGGGAPAPSKSPGGGSADPKGGKTGTTACNDNDLSITTAVWRQDSGQRLLITATNFTDKACTLYHYPYVGFGIDIEGPISAVDSTKPKAVATIGPKEKAYAGLFLYRGNEQTVASFDSLHIGYQDRAFNSNRDVASLDVALSKEIGSLNVGTNPRTTYWNLDLRAVEDSLFGLGKGNG